MLLRDNKKQLTNLLAVLALSLAASAGSACAAALPSCQDMLSFAGTIKPGDVWRLNPTNRMLVLPTSFSTPQFNHLFGAKALDLPRTEIDPILKDIKTCMATAWKAKHRDDVVTLRVLDGGIRKLADVQGEIARVQAHFDAAFKQVADLPPSRDKLVALVVLTHAQPGSTASKDAEKFFDHDINGNNASKQVHGLTLQLMSPLLIDLRTGPDGLGARMDPVLGQMRETLTVQLTDSATAEVAAVPATLNGLGKLAALEKEDHRLYDLVMPEGNKAKIAAAFAARGEAIQDGIQKQMTDAIAAAPLDGNGMNQLGAIGQGPALAALSASRQEALKRTLTARRDAILDAMVQAATARLASFPTTLDGLRDTARFAQEVDHGLGQAAGGTRMQVFDAAAQHRIADIGTATFTQFKTGIEAFPNTRQGLAAIARTPAEIGPILALLPAALRSQYVAVVTEKRSAIEEAVKREDVRLAALPLSGAVYAEPSGIMRIEFRSTDHAFLTAGGSTLDVTWQETDGHVILNGLPQGNVVFERQGGSLVGSGIRLIRQGE